MANGYLSPQTYREALELLNAAIVDTEEVEH